MIDKKRNYAIEQLNSTEEDKLKFMLGSMKNIVIGTSVILGTILGPVFYLISPEWCILYGGVTAGVIAFLIGEFND